MISSPFTDIREFGSRGLRILGGVVVVVGVAMLRVVVEGGNLPGLRSRLPLSEQSSDTLYPRYGDDPWGASTTANWNIPQGSAWQRANQPEGRNVRSNSTKLRWTRKNSSATRRSRRGVVHLYNMVLCATGCNPLAYKGYGCYCGFLGSGLTVDAIDRCCKMHDSCYEAAGCPMFSEYFFPYYWKCYRGNEPICAAKHGELGGAGSCAQKLCECDRALATCLRRFPCPRGKAVCISSTWRLVQNLFMM